MSFNNEQISEMAQLVDIDMLPPESRPRSGSPPTGNVVDPWNRQLHELNRNPEQDRAPGFWREFRRKTTTHSIESMNQRHNPSSRPASLETVRENSAQ